MNETLDYLTDDDKRQRFMDLSFSLYECLADLMADVNAWSQLDEYHTDDELERIRISAMNCTADIHLLTPVLRRVMRYVLESTVN